MFRRTSFLTKEKIGEQIYSVVDKVIATRAIKQMGGSWIPYAEGRIGNKVVYEHVDTRNFITGWYKVRTKITYSDGSYTYEYNYYKRVGE